MQLKPLADNVVVKALPPSETTKSGIVIPDTVEKDKPEQAEVVAVGPGRMLQDGQRAPVAVKPGDKVVFRKKYGLEVTKIDGQEFYILEESDLLATIE